MVAARVRGDIIRAEGALFGWLFMGAEGLSRREGALEFIAEVLKVFLTDLQLQHFFDHRGEKYASERMVPSGAAPAGSARRRTAARTKAFSTVSIGTPRWCSCAASTRSARRTTPQAPGVAQ